MPQKKHKPEEIVAKLRQVDVFLSQGRSVGEAVRSIGVTQFTYYRWRKEFGGLKGDQVKRLKELEKENDRLRKAVSDLTLGEADPERGCLGKLLLYSGRMMQAPFYTSTMSEIILRGSCFSPRSAFCSLMMGSEGKGGAI